jgi:hypothetical protein
LDAEGADAAATGVWAGASMRLASMRLTGGVWVSFIGENLLRYVALSNVIPEPDATLGRAVILATLLVQNCDF